MNKKCFKTNCLQTKQQKPTGKLMLRISYFVLLFMINKSLVLT